jgi:DNA-directed RNA polymerase subunit RPC12/RpoP
MALKISIQINAPPEMTKIWVTCPMCNHKEWYYSFWARKCNICGSIFDDIKSISENMNTRLKFHKK